MLTKLKGYRTILVNVAAIVGAFAAFAAGINFDGDIAVLFTTALAGVNVLLRAITTSPLFKK